MVKEGTIYPSKTTAARDMQQTGADSALIEKVNADHSDIKKCQEKIATFKDVLGKGKKAFLEAVIPSKKKKEILGWYPAGSVLPHGEKVPL